MTDNPTITEADLLPVTQEDRELAERLCFGMREKAIAEAAMLIARHRHSASSGPAGSWELIAAAREVCGAGQASGASVVRLRAALAALSPETRSNGAGEDVDAVFAAALEELDRECRCAAVRGEDGKRVGGAVLRKHFGPAMLLSRDEFAPLTNSALRAQVAALSAPQGEVERLRLAATELLDGLSSTYRARNGREMGIEADDGERCYIVHSDLVTGLRAALAQPEAGGE